METMKFNAEINASPAKVWDVLWGEASYPVWTAAFAEGSHVETDWQKGSKVLFLDGNNRGMVSRIADHVPNQFMSIEHLGEYKDGVEDYDSPSVKEWAGAKENYTLSPSNGGTHLLIEMDMGGSDTGMIDYFKNTWPKALNKVKELAEQ